MTLKIRVTDWSNVNPKTIRKTNESEPGKKRQYDVRKHTWNGTSASHDPVVLTNCVSSSDRFGLSSFC